MEQKVDKYLGKLSNDTASGPQDVDGGLCTGGSGDIHRALGGYHHRHGERQDAAMVYACQVGDMTDGDHQDIGSNRAQSGSPASGSAEHAK